MTAERYLIVNADDFGQAPGINQGIQKAHQHGIVTSASLMVRWLAATEAAAYGRAHPELSLGLHLDLGEWAYRNDTWVMLYEVVPLDDAAAMAGEIDRQLNRFYDLAGRSPTHLDSHQHVHREEPVRSLLGEAARRLGVPLRGCHPEVRYCGVFYGQNGKGEPFPEAIRVETLLQLVEGLAPGITELACHPGVGEGPDAMYRSERSREVETLCDPRVKAALAAGAVRLCSFADLAGRFRAAIDPAGDVLGRGKME